MAAGEMKWNEYNKMKNLYFPIFVAFGWAFKLIINDSNNGIPVWRERKWKEKGYGQGGYPYAQ